jgi:hypothetical protein
VTTEDYKETIRLLVQAEKRCSKLGHMAPLRRQVSDAIQTATENYAEHIRSVRTFAPEVA